jgi:hypothetical protein
MFRYRNAPENETLQILPNNRLFWPEMVFPKWFEGLATRLL